MAWDPWGNDKTKLSFSAGRYYDTLFLAVPLVEMEPPTTTMLFDALFVAGEFRQFGLVGGVNPSVNIQIVDRDISAPYQDELAFSFERELWPESSIRLSYIKRDYKDQLQDVDVNHASGDHGRCVPALIISNPIVWPAPDTGQLVDLNTGRKYEDTDPGLGDGIVDDCGGDIVRIGGAQGNDTQVPDGLADPYVQNPGWGEVLLVGNFNTTEYEAFVLEFVRRQFRNWQMNASYTWSEAIGDAEDFNQALGNERNLREDERGFVAFDQRHVFKLNAVTITRWGFRLGGAVRWESGLPYSQLFSKLTVFSVPPLYQELGDRAVRTRLRYLTRQRNDQRNPSFWNLDARVGKEFKLGKSTYMQLTAEVFNVLNDGTLRLTEQVNGTNSGERRFGRRFQLGLRLAF